MKVISATQMAEIEAKAYQCGASAEVFMEAAGKGVAEAVKEFVSWNCYARTATLLCGKGNNAGDAYVAGLFLLQEGFKVLAVQIAHIETCSALCQKNYHRFVHAGGQLLSEAVFSDGVLIDGLFGTGFKGNIAEPYASLIKKANASGLPILSIDIPSGVNGNDGKVDGEAILATETFYLQFPKTGFFLQDGWNHVGHLRYVDFGLDQNYVEPLDTTLVLPSMDAIGATLPRIQRNWHKYQKGYVVGMAGSPGMPGAALLSSLAALRSGAGIVRLLHPEGMQNELSASPYELIKTAYQFNAPHKILEMAHKATSFYLGPGIGQSIQVIEMLKSLLPALEKPCVIDADALSLIAAHSIQMPAHSILTPHHGEMARLLKKSSLGPMTLELLDECQAFAKHHQITLILKGAPTFVITHDSPCAVCARGDPGMATAGSGDVLTGLVSALLAQGMATYQAAIAAVNLHAIAGEFAAMDKTSRCVIAHDLIDNFPQAYREMSHFSSLRS